VSPSCWGWEQTLLDRLDLEHTLLKGVLCFMLFAGSAGVRIEHLKDHKWTIATLATFWHGIEEILNSLLFVMIGLSIAVVHTVSGSHFGIIDPAAILVCMAARAVSVYMTYAVVTFSILVQGSTVGRLFKLESLQRLVKSA
jgi:NhaP-type Na+/H+ or K+/H+ antiporter